MHCELAWSYNRIETLREDVGILRVALRNAPSGWATVLAEQLLKALKMLYIKQGGEEELSDAIAQAAGVLDGLSPQTLRWDRLQLCLSGALRLRFSITGAAKDIEHATRAAELALPRTDVGASRHLCQALIQLATCKHALHNAFGDIAHLEDSIALLRQVLCLAPPQSSQWLMAKYDLYSALADRAEATGSLIDLNRAIELVPGSISIQRVNHPQAPTMLTNIAMSFLSRFKMAGSMGDLERATTYCQPAVHTGTASSSRYFDHHTILNSYSKVLRTRYEVIQEEYSVAKALTLQKQLLESVPFIHADRTDILCGLAQTSVCVNSTHTDLEEALNHLLDALNHDYGSAYSKFKNVTDVLSYLSKRLPCLNHEDASKLSTVYATAISLLPQVTSFGLAPRTRLSVIAGSS
jgi:tetratricopeptide (TPR) repeat protein